MNNTLIMLFFILSGNTNVWINAKKTCRGGKQTENSRQLCPHSNISLSCFFTSVGSHTMVWICFNSMHINDYGTQCLFSASCMEVVAATSLFNQWMTGLGYACSELVHMTCCLTTSEIKSVPNSSKWSYLKVRWKASCHRERVEMILFKYREYSIFSLSLLEYNQSVASSCSHEKWQKTAELREKFKPWPSFYPCIVAQSCCEVGVKMGFLVS